MDSKNAAPRILQKNFWIDNSSFQSDFRESKSNSQTEIQKDKDNPIEGETKETTGLVQGACRSPEQRPIEVCDLREKP